jgi:hypothetical protein
MARPPLPIGTAGKIKLAQEGPRKWRATCQFRDFDGEVRKVSRWEETKTKAENKLREAIRDRQVQGADISPETRVPEVYAQWLAQFRTLTDLGNRSGTSLDTYTNRWNKLLLPRIKAFGFANSPLDGSIASSKTSMPHTRHLPPELAERSCRVCAESQYAMVL